MFTIALTLIGIVVFIISLFKSGIKSAFNRLMYFTLTGIVLDVVMFIVVTMIAASQY